MTTDPAPPAFPPPPTPTPSPAAFPAAPVETALPDASPAPSRTLPPHRSNRWWLVLAATLAAAILVALVIVVVPHRHSHRSSSTTPTTAIPTGSSAVVGWFAAASGPGCQGATAGQQPTGAIAAVICTVGAINVIYCRMAVASAASAYLASLQATHQDAVRRAWGGRAVSPGQVLAFTSDHGPALAWTYTGQPYLGIAEGGTRAGLDAWWLIGRAVRPGAG